MADKHRAAGGLSRFRLKRILKAAFFLVDEPRGAVPADSAQCAPLRDLVAEAARAARVPVPTRVALVPYAQVSIEGEASRGFTLNVGAPLVLGMPVLELKVVLAHSMAALREPHPALADALIRACQGAQNQVDLFGLDEPFSPSFEKVLTASARFRADLEQRADRAAATVAGSREQALIALTRAQVIAEHFIEYAPRYLIANSTEPWEVFADWLRVAAQPVPAWAVYSQPVSQLAPAAAVHPGLPKTTDDLARARQAVNPLVPPACEPVLLALPGDTDAALAGWLDDDFDDGLDVDYGAAWQAVTAAATGLAGHEATAADVVRLLADGRGPDLVAAWREITNAQISASEPTSRAMERVLAAVRTAQPTLGELVEAFIAGLAVQHGYRYDPVLRPGVLVKDGEPGVEFHSVVARTVDGDTGPLAELVAQLESAR